METGLMPVAWIRTGVLLMATSAFVVLPQGGVNFGLTGEEPVLPFMGDLSMHLAPVGPFSRRGSQLCHLLHLKGKQKRLCRKDPSLAIILYEAALLSTRECQHQFRQDRWNCSLGVYRTNILQKGFRETAFLYAMSAAGLTHSLSRACSTHQLEQCSCAHAQKAPNTRDTSPYYADAWLWGGCDDNIKFGLRFTKKFFEAKSENRDLKANIDKHNSRVGMKVVKNGLHEICKCHGVSGSCTTRTCWRTLSEFKKIGQILKMKYSNAVQYPPGTNKAGVQELFLRKRKRRGNDDFDRRPYPRKRDLVYLEESTNFCESSDFSPGTKGRECLTRKDCESLCCGRGYNVRIRYGKEPCNCTFTWCCHAKCEGCLYEKEIYTCK